MSVPYFVRHLVLVMLAFGLVACDDRVLPFQKNVVTKKANILVLPDDQNYLRLDLDALALPSLEQAAIVDALSDRLSKADIPVGGKRLKGGHRLGMEAFYDEAGALQVYWSLNDAENIVYADGFVPSDLVFKKNDPDNGTIANYDALSRWVANRVTEPVRDAFADGRYIQVKDAQLFDLDVVIGGIRNAPGDGNEAMAKALITVLSQSGLRVARAEDVPANKKAALYLSANITAKALDKGISLLSLQWRMEDDTGNSLGRMDQQNPITSEAINGRWGVLAFEIAASMRSDVKTQVENRKKGSFPQ